MYNGVAEEKIIMDLSEYAENLSKGKIKSYAKNYPKAVAKIAVMLWGRILSTSF